MRYVLLLALTACGTSTTTSDGGSDASIGADSGDPSDAGSTDTDSGTITDSATDTGVARCDPMKPFGAPAQVSGLENYNVLQMGSLSPDELTMYFSSPQLYYTTRVSAMTPFLAPAFMFGNITNYQDNRPAVTADGLTLYFESNRPGTMAPLSIFTTQRPMLNAPFGAVLDVSMVDTQNPQYRTASAFITPKGETLYFAQQGNGAGGYDLSKADCPNNACGKPQPDNFFYLNTFQDETFPVLSQDELTIFFARGNGSLTRIFTATRPNKTMRFAQAQIVSELIGVGKYDTPGWLSPDGCNLYGISDRFTGAHAFIASRPK